MQVRILKEYLGKPKQTKPETYKQKTHPNQRTPQRTACFSRIHQLYLSVALPLIKAEEWKK